MCLLPALGLAACAGAEGPGYGGVYAGGYGPAYAGPPPAIYAAPPAYAYGAPPVYVGQSYGWGRRDWNGGWNEGWNRGWNGGWNGGPGPAQRQFYSQGLAAQQQLYNQRVTAAQQRYNQQVQANPAAAPWLRQQMNQETAQYQKQLQENAGWLRKQATGG
jgi:hypothetical protein